MTLVHVYWKTGKVRPTAIPGIVKALPTIVSRALSVPAEAAFGPKEVTIMTFTLAQPTGDDQFDFTRQMGPHDVGIVIWANHWPEREARKDELADRMSNDLREHVPMGNTAFVWLVLSPAGYAGFTGRCPA